MFQTLAQKWLSLPQNVNADDVDSTTAAVVMDFANWLDMQRGLTPDAPVTGQDGAWVSVNADGEITCKICGRGLGANVAPSKPPRAGNP